MPILLKRSSIIGRTVVDYPIEPAVLRLFLVPYLYANYILEDTMPTEEKPNVEQVVWEPPSDGEPPKEEEIPIEKPSITQVDDAEVSKENGHLNGSINEGIIEEPQSETESEVFHNTNANIQEVPEVEPAAEEAPEMAPEIKIHSESSGEDEPLSRLRKPVEVCVSSRVWCLHYFYFIFLDCGFGACVPFSESLCPHPRPPWFA